METLIQIDPHQIQAGTYVHLRCKADGGAATGWVVRSKADQFYGYHLKGSGGRIVSESEYDCVELVRP